MQSIWINIFVLQQRTWKIHHSSLFFVILVMLQMTSNYEKVCQKPKRGWVLQYLNQTRAVLSFTPKHETKSLSAFNWHECKNEHFVNMEPLWTRETSGTHVSISIHDTALTQCIILVHSLLSWSRHWCHYSQLASYLVMSILSHQTQHVT